MGTQKWASKVGRFNKKVKRCKIHGDNIDLNCTYCSFTVSGDIEKLDELRKLMREHIRDHKDMAYMTFRK